MALEVEKLRHLDHIEDLPIRHGVGGFNHIYNTLINTHDYLNGKRPKDFTLSTKYDGCLHKDTQILMSDGSIQTIDQIINSWSLAQTSFVLGVDESTGTTVITEVIDVLKAQSQKQWVRIDLEKGSLILTEDHQVMTDRGWIAAKDLVAGDDIKEDNNYK